MNPTRILSIDDDADFHILLEKKLSKYNIELITTDRCDNFILLLRTHKPDICLLDMNLSEGAGAGILLLKAIRNTPYVNKIFAVSRRSKQEEISYVLEQGADEFLPKPLDEELLIHKIGLHLNISLNLQSFKYKKIAESYSNIEIGIDLQLDGLTENSIFIQSPHLFATNSYCEISLPADLASLNGGKKIKVKVKEQTYFSKKNCYLTELAIDEFDKNLSNRLRTLILKTKS